MTSKALKKIKCDYSQCDVSFEPKRSWHKYHDKKCRLAAYYERRLMAGFTPEEVKEIKALLRKKKK